MQTNNIHIVLQILSTLFIILLNSISCTENSSNKDFDFSRIIAIVDQDTIFVDDFIKRCEYTIRPDYCRQNSLVDKNICLNSLIAEKLFAVEAENKKNLLTNNNFLTYLQGLKEQLMREELIRDRVLKEIEISDNEIEQAYKNSRKIIKTETVFVADQCDINAIYKQAHQGISFEQISKEYPGVSKKISSDVRWGHIDRESQNAIFNDSVKTGTVLSPLKTKGGYRLIKVVGWQETVELSEANRNQEKENIKKRLLDYYIEKKYLAYVQNLMNGKKIDFFKEGWQIIVNNLRRVYLQNEETADISPEPSGNMESIYGLLEDHGKQAFLELDGKVWHIDDFNKAIQIHPLELNTSGLTEDNFPFRLRASIASLMIDEYLTDIAYENKYDKSKIINRQVKEWKTHFMFFYQRDEYLHKAGFKGKITKDYINAFDNFLTPYFNSLKLKYNEKIYFNHNAIEKIQLTDIPMITHKTKGPYLQVVPSFPVVTNTVKVNYRRINNIH